jgi:hypothetical protein
MEHIRYHFDSFDRVRNLTVPYVNQRIDRETKAQLSFLLLHAIKGWCPPVTVMRRLGFRTKPEIESEKVILKNILEDRISAQGMRQTA